jgi:hypothetical protein
MKIINLFPTLCICKLTDAFYFVDGWMGSALVSRGGTIQNKTCLSNLPLCHILYGGAISDPPNLRFFYVFEHFNIKTNFYSESPEVTNFLKFIL